MTFKNLNIKQEYRTLRDEIISAFYIPVLKESIIYKRSVAYFSSTSLIEISYGINALISNGGKIMLITSPNLSEEDITAINYGYELRESVITNYLLNSLQMNYNHFELERLNVIANLIAEDKLDIKIALSNKNGRYGLYHEKLGIFQDRQGNRVAFTGSLNETKEGFINNYEVVDTFKSWETNMVDIKENAFDKLWNNEDEFALVIDFPDIIREKIMSFQREKYIWDKEQYFLSDTKLEYLDSNIPKIPYGIELHDYQKRAIENWKSNNYLGIFDMATGTGKTFTGLSAIVRLYLDFKKCAVIIVCPYQHLVDQWVEDIEFFNMKPIIGHSNSIQKNFKNKLKNEIFDYSIGIKQFLCFVCTNATFSSENIQQELKNLNNNVLLLVDEAHNFGAEKLSKTLLSKYQFRLGLSATIERYRDIEGTNLLFDYFGKKCIEYSLEQAIRDNVLTPYKYFPKVVNLTSDERDRYRELTMLINKNMVRNKDGTMTLSEIAKLLLIKRSRIVAGASNKILELEKIIIDYRNDNHMLIYCGTANYIDESIYSSALDEDVRQIDAITNILGNVYDMRVVQFTSNESSSERKTIREEFAIGKSIQAIVAIKCLDEGVNIPEIKTVFILASTTNPKEYIQRRGRVLRKSPGKDYAVIYDFVTLPRSINETYGMTKEEILKENAMVKNEINRINEFKRMSTNPMISDILIEDLRSAFLIETAINNIGEDELHG